MPKKLLLRAETKPGERRTPLVPDAIPRLRDEGITVEIESSPSRIHSDREYAIQGARIVPAGTWIKASEKTLILGLKELPDETSAAPLTQRHCYFAHCLKGQPQAASLLDRFNQGGGLLFDLECLTDDQGRRVAAFGYWAGFVGAALGVLAWAEQRNSPPLRHKLSPWPDANELIETVARSLGSYKPRVGVTGYLGRAGQGAITLLRQLGLGWQGWDQKESGPESPLLELLEMDVAVHCVGSQSPRPPLLEAAHLLSPKRRLSVLVDVTCDQGGPLHLFPFYRQGTTLDRPAIRLRSAPPLDLIAIDHLPTLLPRESSREFSDQLLPHLLDYFGGAEKRASPWSRAAQRFQDAVRRTSLRRDEVIR